MLLSLSAQLTCQMALIRRIILTVCFFIHFARNPFFEFYRKVLYFIYFFKQNFINLLFSPDG